MKRFTKEQFKVMPWKNGGGVTTELIKLSSPGSEFDFRLSIANVDADGPFSFFPGIDRTLLILQGAGCVLEMKGKKIRLTPSTRPYSFSGEETIFCHLENGPITDFNVMVRRNWGEVRIEVNPQQKAGHCESDLLYVYYPATNNLIEVTRDEIFQLESSACICVWVKKKAG